MPILRLVPLAAILALAACDATYRPGVSGAKPIFEQNLSANKLPEPAASRPR